MYSPRTYTHDLPFKYRTRYATSHFSAIDSQQTESLSSRISSSATTNSETYSPNVWDVVGIIAIGIVARPILLPMWLINQGSSQPEVY
jgi:hypothetical protein